MKCSMAQKLINDYVDNLLEAGQAGRLESHLDRCADCREYLIDMRYIANNARGLEAPDPSDDLWPVIKRQVLKNNRNTLMQRKGLFRNLLIFPRGPAFALGTLLAVMILIPLLYYGLPHIGKTNNYPDSIAIKNLKIAEQQYQSAIEALSRTIETQNTKLNPELMAVFKKNLAIIDESIRICKKSMDNTPGILETNRLLLICYRKKIELLNDIKDIAMQS